MITERTGPQDPSSIAAVILAAGFGTRLAPLTDHTPKPLLVVGDRPVAGRLIDRLTELSNLRHIVAVVNAVHLDQWRTWRNREQARIGSTPRIELIPNGVHSVDDRPGAVADLLAGIDATEPADRVIVLAGDNLLDEPLLPHVRAARNHDGIRTSVLLCRDLGDDVPPGRFGEVTVDDRGHVICFREKPADPQSPLVATCSYVLHHGVAADLRRFLEDGGDPDSPGSFIAWLAVRHPVLARPLVGRYFDIGNHETLAEARAAYDT